MEAGSCPSYNRLNELSEANMHIYLIAVTMLANLMAIFNDRVRGMLEYNADEFLVGLAINNVILVVCVAIFVAEVRARNEMADYN